MRPWQRPRGRQAGACRAEACNDQREGHDARVDPNGIDPRQSVGDERDDRLQRPHRHSQADGRRREREQHAFRNQLLRQTGAARTQRRTDGQLLPAPLATEEEQVRDVGTGHQQHETDHREEEPNGY